MTPAVARQQGFTLIEVLVYLALAASILAVLAGGTFVVRRGTQSVMASGERLEMLDLGLQAFADDAARIERLVAGSADAPRYVFSGGPGQMVYVLADRPRPSVPSLMLVRLRVREDGRGSALVRERAAYDAATGQQASAWGDATTLVQGPYSMALAYRAARGHDTGWLEDWTDTRRLPDRARLTIIDRRTGRNALPPLTAALFIDAEPACADLAAAGCTISSSGALAWRTP